MTARRRDLGEQWMTRYGTKHTDSIPTMPYSGAVSSSLTADSRA